MDLMDVFVKIGADTSGLEDGIKKTQGLVGGLGKAFGAGIATLGMATTAVGNALVDGTGKVAEYGDNIDKMSQKMGLTAEAYQEWDAVMQHSGTSMESMKASMKTLAVAVESGNEAFERIGLTQEELANMSQQDIFEATIAGLQNVEDTTERTYLAGKLLGKGATELGALLNTSAEDTQAMRDRVHELGGVMSDDAVKAAAAYQDQLQDMTTAFDGVKRGLLSDFMPSLTEVMGGLTEIFSGNYDAGLEQISKGIDNVVTNLADVLPQMLEVGVKILESLAKSILENIPKLLPTLVELVMGIGQMIIDNLPLLIESAAQLVLELGKGLAEALPELVPAIVDVMIAIAEYLIENIDILIDAAIQLVMGLAQGLINAAPRLIEAAPRLIKGLIDALVENLPMLIDGAIQLVGALAQAIIENAPLLLSAGVEAITALIGGLTQALPSLMMTGMKLMTELAATIISAIPKFLENGAKLIGSLIEGMLTMLSAIVKAALDLITQFIKGIKDSFSRIISAGKETVNAFKNGIKQKIEDAKNWGRDLISNFIGGIMEKWDSLKNTVSSVAGSIKDFLGFSEPKLGPLSNFHTFAPDMMELFAKGVKDNEKMLDNVIASAFDFTDLIGNAPKMSLNGQPQSGETNIYMNIYGAVGQPVEELANIVSERINDATGRRMMAMGVTV